MPFCAKCGAKYQIGQYLCSGCNEPLPDTEEIKYDLSSLNESHVIGSKRLRFFAGIIDILVVVGLAAFFLSPRARLLNMVGLRRVISFGAPSLYLLLKDCIDGKSIGKFFMGLTVFLFKATELLGTHLFRCDVSKNFMNSVALKNIVPYSKIDSRV